MNAWLQGLTLRHFAPSEFDHPEMMSPEFLRIIDEWRDRCGFAIRIMDDGRTEAELQSLYRDRIAHGEQPPDSAHLRGCAIDCKPWAPDPVKELTMIAVATDMWRKGEWPGLGLEVATRHLHLDSDPHLIAQGLRPNVWPGVSK